jgi:hypothetical protein
MSTFRFELRFPDPSAVEAWRVASPHRELLGSLPHDVIPNDAEDCPSPSALFGNESSDGALVIAARDDVDPWHAIWAFVAAHSHGGIGRAVAVEVPYQWEEDRVHLLVSLTAEGIDSQILSGRQAQAYVASPDLPPLKEMKARLKS